MRSRSFLVERAGNTFRPIFWKDSYKSKLILIKELNWRPIYKDSDFKFLSYLEKIGNSFDLQRFVDFELLWTDYEIKLTIHMERFIYYLKLKLLIRWNWIRWKLLHNSLQTRSNLSSSSRRLHLSHRQNWFPANTLFSFWTNIFCNLTNFILFNKFILQVGQINFASLSKCCILLYSISYS